jgi:hypothetical protein
LSTSIDFDNPKVITSLSLFSDRNVLALHLPKGFKHGVHIKSKYEEESRGENEYLIKPGVMFRYLGSEEHPNGVGEIHHFAPHQSFLPESWVEDNPDFNRYIKGSMGVNQFFRRRAEGDKSRIHMDRYIVPEASKLLKSFKDHENHLIDDVTVYHHTHKTNIKISEFKKSGFFKTKAVLSTSLDFDNPVIVSGMGLNIKREVLALHLPKGFKHGVHIKINNEEFRGENEYAIKPGVMFRYLGSEEHPNGVGEIHHFTPHQYFLP